MTQAQIDLLTEVTEQLIDLLDDCGGHATSLRRLLEAMIIEWNSDVRSADR